MQKSSLNRRQILAGASAAFAAGCSSEYPDTGSSLPPTSSTAPTPLPLSPPPSPPTTPAPPTTTAATTSLKAAYANNFAVGAAVQNYQLRDGHPDGQLLLNDYNMLVAEYEMKASQLGPAEGVYNFTVMDQMVDYAERHNLEVRGHALLWHYTTPHWMIEGGDPATIKRRVENYVTAVVSRYRGRIKAWDVVNEVASDLTGRVFRDSPWYQITGHQFLDWAFHAARAADPSCKLFINEYDTEKDAKRQRLFEIVRGMQSRGVPLDGVGHQVHWRPTSSLQGLATALDEAASLGLENHITELDVTIYTDGGHCYWAPPGGCDPQLPSGDYDRTMAWQAQAYRDIFDLAVARPSVRAVLIWGLHDEQSWLNTYPITRTNYPLLIDRSHNPKPAYHALVDRNYVIGSS